MADDAQRRTPGNCGGAGMINDNSELRAAQERITYFQDLLLQLRETARPEEFPIVALGYRLEIERMQREALDYLTRHISQPAKAA